MKTKSIIAFTKQIFELKSNEKALFVRTIISATIIHLSLKIWSFKSVAKYLGSYRSIAIDKKNEASNVQYFNKVLKLSYKLSPYLFNCLSLSLCYWLFFKKIGIKTNLKFGNIKNGNKIKGHAWLIYKNKCITVDPLIDKKFEAFSINIL